MKTWKYSGHFMIATGIIHNLLGFVMGWDVLERIASDGFVNSVNDQMDRNAIFWFLFSGFMMMILGSLMNQKLKSDQQPLPTSQGYFLLALTVIGCVMMPISGFWIVIPQALIIIFAKRATREVIA